MLLALLGTTVPMGSFSFSAGPWASCQSLLMPVLCTILFSKQYNPAEQTPVLFPVGSVITSGYSFLQTRTSFHEVQEETFAQAFPFPSLCWRRNTADLPLDPQCLTETLAQGLTESRTFLTNHQNRNSELD